MILDGPIRVLVVDSSTTGRSLIVRFLDETPGFEVVGQARNGREAVDMCRLLRPDVVTMELFVAEMGGVQATEQIMAHFPTPILVLCPTSHRAREADIQDALAAGAVDVLDQGPEDVNSAQWRQRLLHRLKVVAKVHVISHPRGRLSQQPTPSPGAPTKRSEQTAARSLIAMGGSTGGPGAVAKILQGLPPEFSTPILLVLHTSAPFGQGLAAWFNAQTNLPVRYAVDSEPLVKISGVVMAPPGQHLTVQKGRLRLTLGPERFSCRPSVDVLFESLAQEMGPRICACLLTGMGKDGAQGLLALRRAGAVTIAQDEASCVVFGMPREAILLGGATRIAALDQIAELLVETTRAQKVRRGS